MPKNPLFNLKNYSMKFNVSLILILIGLFCSSSMSGQAFILRFKIWKKTASGDIDMGIYQRTVSASPHNYKNSDPFNLQEDICPGDQIVLQNLCERQTPTGMGNHDFTGSSSNYGRMTLGLTNANHCSNPNPPANYVDIVHLADVGSYNSSLPTYQSWSSWNHGDKKTVTITPASPLNVNGNVYLAISAGMFGYTVNTCGCGNRYYFIRMNLKEGVDPMGDIDICPDDVVSLNLNSNYTYSNWSPNNPHGPTPNTTTTYTVTVTENGCTNTNKSTGCLLSDEFTIHVNEPPIDLITRRFVCYNQISSINLTNAQANFTAAIRVDGEVIYDLGEGIDRLPFYIGSQIQGSGAVNIEYTYWVGNNQNQTCTKTYQ